MFLKNGIPIAGQKKNFFCSIITIFTELEYFFKQFLQGLLFSAHVLFNQALTILWESVRYNRSGIVKNLNNYTTII